MIVRHFFHTDAIKGALGARLVQQPVGLESGCVTRFLARVTMYKLDEHRLPLGTHNQISFDIDSRTAYRVQNLAKFYFNIDEEEDMLLLKLVLSEPNHEVIEWKKPNSSEICGMKFLGDHGFAKAELVLNDARAVLDQYSQPAKNSIVHIAEDSYLKESDLKGECRPQDILHLAFINAKQCHELTISHKETKEIKHFSRIA